MDNKIVLNVKDQSISTFLRENMIMQNGEKPRSGGCGESPYYILGRKLYLRADKFPVGSTINIELRNTHEGTGYAQINKYKYNALYYDDVCVLLELVDFKIDCVPVGVCADGINNDPL